MAKHKTADIYTKATVFFEEYSDQTLYGNVDEDEALQNASDWVWRSESEEVRAERYAELKETWDATQPAHRFSLVFTTIGKYL